MMKRMVPLALIVLASGTMGARAAEQSGPKAPLLMQKPTVSKTHVVFSYADDLWSVPRAGGEARRLTSGQGVETDPHFSPDGQWVAFTGQYEGNDDVYVVSADGGDARRLTYHPGSDQVVGWSPDGKKVLFRSARNSYSRFTRLYTIAVEGTGLPEEVPLPIADHGCYSPDGKKMAYVPFHNGSRSSGANVAWKRYRGGRQPVIWIADLSDSSVEKIDRKDSNDACPMWIENTLYFLSDRDGPVSLFAYDPAGKKATKLIENGKKDYDLKYASAGPDCIVCEKPGELFLFDLKSKKSTPVPVTIKAELPSLKPRWVKVADSIGGAGLSPTGARAVFEARGEIFTVPASKGEIRNISKSAAVHDRYPAWSPDGKSIAYFSDESGDYKLHVRPQDGKGEVKKIEPGESPSFYYSPVWSPDSKKIAYTDKRLNLWYVDLDTGKNVKIDTNPTNDGRIGSITWAPDSKWVGYTKQLKSHLSAVFVYNLEKAKATQLTDNMADVGSCAFDKGGKYLYFTASTNVGPARGSLMSTLGRSSSSSAYLVVLSSDDESPLGPESDEEKGDKGDEERIAEMKKAMAEKGKKEPAKVKIDFDEIDQRILSLPIGSGNYGGLIAGRAGTVFLAEFPEMRTMARGGGGFGLSISRFDLAARRATPVISGVQSFTVSANGDKILYRQGTRWTITSSSGGSVPDVPTPLLSGRGGRGGSSTPTSGGGGGALDLSGMEVRIDPRAEWRQIYNEVWRIERDFLYDPGFHGLNLKETAKKYEAFLPGVASRNDLAYLFEEMLGELSLGHVYIRGGDRPTVSGPSNGLLGCDFAIADGRYKITRVYRGENWNSALRAPLTQPGNRVKEGEFLLAIDDEELKGEDNVYRLLEGTAGKMLTLKVGSSADGKGSREVKVRPTTAMGEQQLRHYAWVTDNRAKVDAATKGMVGYVYLPDTSVAGYTRFIREFYAQVGKEGAIIDERFNGGGFLADEIIETLDRKPFNYAAAREGADVVFPRGIYGPKVMIVNESAGSGGDYLPYVFRQQKVGTIVGKKTWGGLVGIGGFPPLLDGGSVTAPNWAIYFPNGKWDVENVGVSPDVEVEFDPKLWRQGKDPQLERAIEIALKQMQQNPWKWPQRPAYPNYHAEKAEKKDDKK